MNVFEKLHEASQNASGVNLTELDVHLLLETASTFEIHSSRLSSGAIPAETVASSCYEPPPRLSRPTSSRSGSAKAGTPANGSGSWAGKGSSYVARSARTRTRP